jgi:hypothetical protein
MMINGHVLVITGIGHTGNLQQTRPDLATGLAKYWPNYRQPQNICQNKKGGNNEYTDPKPSDKTS